MRKLRLFAITSLILVSFTVFAGQSDDRKNENSTERRVATLEEKVESLEASDANLQGRVSALEASDVDTKSRLDALEKLGEYLLTWDPVTGSPDCGLLFEVDKGDGSDIILGSGKDTFPPSFTAEYRGDLTAYIRRAPQTPSGGCDLADIPAATSHTDILAIHRPGCAFIQMAQNAADSGYGALIIFDTYSSYAGSIRPVAPDGFSPFPIPTMYSPDWLEIQFGSWVIEGPAQYCTEYPHREFRSQ